MTLKEALAKGVAVLKKAGVETPAADACILLCFAADCDRTYLYAHGEQVVAAAVLEKYEACLFKRSGRMPVQYITGHCEFMSLDFYVGPEVLVPRPDTEILVETAVRTLLSAGKPMTVLDIGTGSGCIAVSVAHRVKSCTVTAADISAAALETAGRNAAKNGVSDRLEFLQSDLFKELTGRKFDVCLSNPPYVRSGDIPGLQREVGEYEPWQALDGGPDGLEFYRRIIGASPGYLNSGGCLFLEVGQGQAPEVARLMEGRYAGIGIARDLAGIDRVVWGRLNIF